MGDDDAMFKAMTEEMVLDIKTAFEAHLADVVWLGQTAREKATEKAEACIYILLRLKKILSCLPGRGGSCGSLPNHC